MPEHDDSLSPSEPDWKALYGALRGADAAYRPIASFADWAGGASVSPYWDQYTNLFRDERAKVGEARSSEIVRAAMRAAATNTGAIEGLHRADRGLTLSVIELAETWQQAVSEHEGPEAVGLIEAALGGYEMALDLVTGAREITEVWIRQVHEIVCRPQETYRALTAQGWQDHELPKGSYKRHPNHVILSDGSVHSYAPVDLTTPEMHRYVTELRSEAFLSAPPALQASYAHHALTAIHPFSDGNGRLARVLASVFTLRGAGVPFVVLSDEQVPYFDSLSRADGGDVGPLVAFVTNRVIGTINFLVELLRAGVLGLEESIARISRAITGQGGLTHQEIDLAAGRLSEALRNELTSRLDGIERPPGVQLSGMGPQYPIQPPEEGLRVVFGQSPPPVGGTQLLNVGPGQAGTGFLFDVLVKKDPTDPLPFVVREFRYEQIAGRGSPFEYRSSVELRLDEIHPQFSAEFTMRLGAWVERIVSELVAAFADVVERSLAEQGFSS